MRDQGDRTSEHRQLTVLFCDIADSTGLSERCDAEDLREILLEFQAVCTRSVEACGGKVLNYIGDGIRAAFGYPLASENDAERAVRAALDLLGEIEKLGERAMRSIGQPVRVRIGIHTGFAVIGKAAVGHVHDAIEIVGDTPNIAARLQEIGTANSIVISDETRHLLRGKFRLLPLGLHSLRGLSREFSVFEVLGEATAEEIARQIRRPSAPLVDRDAELRRLLKAWADAAAGRGRAVAIIGESGIGKSRLARELIEQTGLAEASIFALQASENHQNVPFYPVLQWLEQKIGFGRERTTEGKIGRLTGFLATRAAFDEEQIWLVAQFLGVTMPVPPGLSGIDAEELRRRLLEQLVSILLSRSQQGHGLVLIEDLHWADPSTRELVDRCVARIASFPVLLLITSRTEAGNWPESLERVGLQRLADEDCFSLASLVAQGRELSDQLLQRIVRRSDGVPLFVEELATAAMETGRVDRGQTPAQANAADAQNVPAALYDPLMMRLDRLGAAKGVAQLASVIGRNFSRPLLAALAQEDDVSLDGPLGRLLDSGLIQATGDGSEHGYDFKHALVRDVAYYSLLKRQRRELHGRLAEAIETRFPALAEAEPDYLAQHLSAAGSIARAARLWLTAAKRSAARSANQEAVSQVHSVLQHVAMLPSGAERDDLELDAQIAVIGPEIAREGYAAPAVPEAIRRARDLCRGLVDDPRIFPVLYAQWTYSQVTGNMHASREAAQEVLALAERTRLRAARMVGHRSLGTSLLLTGETEEAYRHLERAIMLYEPQVDRPMAVVYGSDVRVLGLCHFAIACWQVGEVARALSNGKMALELAFELRHANTLGAAFTHVCMLYALERDVGLVETWARRGLEAAKERQLPFWVAVARGFLAWCAVQSGRVDEGIAGFERDFGFFRAANLVYWMPTYLCWWSEAEIRAGKLDEARGRLEEARRIISAGGECWYEAECWRIEAMAAAHERSKDMARARECLERALALAHRRQQWGFALRIALDLARLLAAQGETNPARTLLAEAMRPFAGQSEFGDRADAIELLRVLDTDASGSRQRAGSGEA